MPIAELRLFKTKFQIHRAGFGTFCGRCLLAAAQDKNIFDPSTKVSGYVLIARAAEKQEPDDQP
jgi:hypothetical protein